MKEQRVNVKRLRCWGCGLLKKNLKTGIHYCPRNRFEDSVLFLPFFGEKCELFVAEQNKEVDVS